MTFFASLRLRSFILASLITPCVLSHIRADQFFVTNLFDSGAGSLRDAITQAEALTGANQITFQVGGTLDFGSVLPTVSSDISINSNGFGVTFDGTSAGGRGFRVGSGGALSLTDFTVQNFFEGGSSGGAIRVESGNLSIFSSSFLDNTGFTGGSIFAGGSSVFVQDSIFSGNRGLQGGAISISGTTLEIENSQLTNNTAIAPTGAPGGAGIGGALSLSGGSNVTILDSNIDNNVGEVAGGGLRVNGGTLNVENSSINGNASQGVDEDGGGLIVFGGSQVIIADSEINENTSDGNGGGIQAQNSGTSISLVRTTVDENTASGAGGGIRADEADLNITQSTLSGNEAQGGEGGAINALRGGDLNIENSTISTNTASGGGGGVVATNGTGGEIESSTIAFNTSNGGGAGVRFSSDQGSTLVVSNSILSENRNGGILNSLSGSVDSGGNNLFDDGGGSIVGAQSSDQLNGFADLQGLANNGGPTLTHALGASSDAIGNGSTDLAVDQRGFLRPAGDAADVGAVEFGAVPEPSNAALLIGLSALLFASKRRRRYVLKAG